MINENDVVKAIVIHLKRNGYSIIQELTTNEQGIDIIAEHLSSKHRLYIEAKGQTSSKESTERYGKEFSVSQIRNHVGRAILATMMVLVSKPAGPKTKAGIGLPITQGHLNEIGLIKPALKQLGIKLFWVDNNMNVYED